MKRMLFLASAFLAHSLQAETTLITTEPVAPLESQRVTVTAGSDWACPPSSIRLEVDVEARRIAIVNVQPQMPCPPMIHQWTASGTTDPLPAGLWSIQAQYEHAGGERTVLSARTLYVRPADPPLDVHPRAVPERGGMLVRISRPGIGDCPASGTCLDPVVTIGETEATLAVIDRNAIDAVVPAGDAGIESVRVLGRDGVTTWTAEDAIVYVSRDQTPDPSVLERVLVPLMFEGPGGFGSVWTTELRVFNAGLFAVDPVNVFNIPCQGPYGCPPQIPARSVLRLGVPELFQWNHGYVLAVPREVSGELSYGLHIRDLSRQAESWGTEIPIVRDGEMGTTATILDVPLADRYRRTLRIFGLDAIDGSEVTLTWHNDRGAFATSTVQLRTLGRCAVIGPCWLPEPSGAILPLEAPFPEGFLPGDLVRLEVAAKSPLNGKVWAMVSLTNNETQQVTTITPQ